MAHFEKISFCSGGNLYEDTQRGFWNHWKLVSQKFGSNLNAKRYYYMYFRNGSQNDDFILNEIISGAIVDNELEFELIIKNVCK